MTAAQEGRENTATPRELITMLRAIHEGRMLGKATTGDFFKMLSMQKSGYITRLLPADLIVANKPGNLDGVRNDAHRAYRSRCVELFRPRRQELAARARRSLRAACGRFAGHLSM